MLNETSWPQLVVGYGLGREGCDVPGEMVLILFAGCWDEFGVVEVVAVCVAKLLVAVDCVDDALLVVGGCAGDGTLCVTGCAGVGRMGAGACVDVDTGVGTLFLRTGVGAVDCALVGDIVPLAFCSGCWILLLLSIILSWRSISDSSFCAF